MPAFSIVVYEIIRSHHTLAPALALCSEAHMEAQLSRQSFLACWCRAASSWLYSDQSSLLVRRAWRCARWCEVVKFKSFKSSVGWQGATVPVFVATRSDSTWALTKSPSPLSSSSWRKWSKWTTLYSGCVVLPCRAMAMGL